MHTQCPYCQTLFRINAEQLKVADGKAHCCRCDKIFNALENLHEQEQDSAWPASRFPDSNTPQQELPLTHTEEDPESDDLVDLLLQIDTDSFTIEKIDLDQDIGIEIDTDLLEEQPTNSDPFEPAYDLTDLDLDSFTLDSETFHQATDDSAPFASDDPELSIAEPSISEQTLENLLSASTESTPQPPTQQQKEPAPAEQKHHKNTNPNKDQFGEHRTIEDNEQPTYPPQSDDTLPFDLPDNLPPIEPAQLQPLALDQLLIEKKGPGTFAWSTMILLLLVMGLGQLAWYQRDLLMEHPDGRRAFEQICQHVKCELPPRKAPEKIAVMARSITVHPTNPQALQVTLTVRNQANFLQSWPYLQLSLYTTEEHLAARRTFNPQEYTDGNQLLIPGAPLTIHFDIEDPGETVTGFKFDFL